MSKRRKAGHKDYERKKGGTVIRVSERAGEAATLSQGCGRKVAYASKKTARDQAKRVSKLRGEPMDWYKCREGGRLHFHIGHPKGYGAERFRKIREGE